MFSQNDYKKNYKVIYKYFKEKYGRRSKNKKSEINLDEIKHNDLMSDKYKKTCKYLNYVEHLLILASKITGCLSISAFASFLCVPIGITSSAVGMNIWAVTAGTKK